MPQCGQLLSPSGEVFYFFQENLKAQGNFFVGNPEIRNNPEESNACCGEHANAASPKCALHCITHRDIHSQDYFDDVG